MKQRAMHACPALPMVSLLEIVRENQNKARIQMTLACQAVSSWVYSARIPVLLSCIASHRWAQPWPNMPKIALDAGFNATSDSPYEKNFVMTKSTIEYTVSP